MDRTVHLPAFLKQADSLRASGRWSAAINSYMAAERVQPEQAGIKHNIALCYLASSDAANALRYAEQAIVLNPGFWQTYLVKAKALKLLGNKEEAISLLVALVRQFPANADIRQELASLSMDELGDAVLARELVRPARQQPRHAMNASLTELMANLYDSAKNAEELSADICRFATEHLVRPERLHLHAPGPASRRRRIGLMSPQFCCSPVYFFGIGALKQLAQEVDLVFLNRGRRMDWASTEFRSIAHEWHETAGLDSGRLADFIARQGLDALLDMGGWMDPVGLSAISTKPVRRLYKWVGGQAATTGIHAFDGFFTDQYQSSPQDQHLYAEPLVFLKHGYVTYTPPAYMPDPVAPDGTDVFGVIANPLKISSAFLAFLKDAVDRYASETGFTVSLRFIDRRYRHARLRQRIASVLNASPGCKQKYLQLAFIVPQSHQNYLEEVGKLTAVIDTFPYSGGLTTVEALALGVPCLTRAGSLFSERHSYAHCMYAGMEASQFDAEKNLHKMLHFYHQSGGATLPRSVLITRSSDRLNHQALAEEMMHHLQAGIHSSS